MARSHEELARFRGDDKSYREGWDRIFKKEKEQNEKAEPNDVADTTSGRELRHSDEDVDRLCPQHASHGQDVLREDECSGGIP